MLLWEGEVKTVRLILSLRQSRSSPPHSALLEMCWPLQMAPIKEVLPPMLKRHPISIHVCIMHYHCLVDLNTVIVHCLFCVSPWCYIRNLMWVPNTLNNLCSHFYLTLISWLSASVFSIFLLFLFGNVLDCWGSFCHCSIYKRPVVIMTPVEYWQLPISTLVALLNANKVWLSTTYISVNSMMVFKQSWQVLYCYYVTVVLQGITLMKSRL